MNSYAPIKLEDSLVSNQDQPFPSTLSSSDSEHTISDEWTRISSRSPAQSPAGPLARSVRGTERQRAGSPHYYRPHIQSPSSSTPTTSPSKPKRIPRPPNAFILYRSDLLKNGQIPDHIERRQQTLSRVAGECWNLLLPEEKQVWQQLAQERAAIHLRDYPNYHFKPSPRGKGKTKLRSNEDKGDELIRSLRETYVGIQGPSICASRQRKHKSHVKEERPAEEIHGRYQSNASDILLPSPPLGEAQDRFRWGSFPASDPSSPSQRGLGTASVAPCQVVDTHDVHGWTPFSTPESIASPSLPSPASALSEPPLPPCFPQHSVPHYAPRRPSTSMGFFRDTSCFGTGYAPERPASAASDTGLTNLVRDLNITPTIASFGHISMPSTPGLYSTYPTVDQPHIRSPFPFSALNAQFPVPFPDPASGLGDVQPLDSTTSGTFTDTQFIMALDDSYGYPTDHSQFSLDSWGFPIGGASDQ
ncbi:hypothetical protein C8R43DRAFT_382644 [Mycena crocata]|nr:hypothetical protein C8R43DRAFT_382644 [Mycena crocata]